MTLRGATLAIAGSFVLAGSAGAQISGQPQLNRQFAVSPKVEEEKKPQITFTKLPITLAPLVMLRTMSPEKFQAAMKDWSPLTAGAVIGSPELYEEDGQVFLVATGANNNMHAGRIDVASMTINPASWTVFDVPHKSNGNTACAANYTGAKSYNLGCHTLTTEGASATVFMHVVNGLVGGSGTQSTDGDRGMSVAYPQVTYTIKNGWGGYSPTRFVRTVWDGARLWSSSATYLKWGVIQMESAASGLGCDHFCAYRRTDGSASYVAIHLDISSTTQKSVETDYWTAEWTSRIRPIGSPTPTLDGADGRPEVVESRRLTRIFMPRKDGSLSYISGPTDRDTVGGVPAWASWKSLGGAIALDSAPSCAPYSQGAICAIKALDGRVYARLVDISKGL